MSNGHDHSHATHSMHCPVKGCGYVMEIHAHDDDEAVSMLVKTGDAHFADKGHPMDESMTPEVKEKMTRGQMQKLEN